MKFLNSALVLSIAFTSVNMAHASSEWIETSASQAALTEAVALDIEAIENEITAGEDQSPRSELRIRKRLHRKFDRQLNRYVSILKKKISGLSGAEAEALLTQYQVSAGGLTRALSGSLTGKIDGILAQQKMNSNLDLKKSLISAIEDPAFHKTLSDELDAQITAAGSAKTYLRLSRDSIRNRCLWKKTGNLALIGTTYAVGGSLIVGGFVSGLFMGFGMGIVPLGTELLYVGGTLVGVAGGAGSIALALNLTDKVRGQCLLEKR